jgi:hypothetical protein
LQPVANPVGEAAEFFLYTVFAVQHQDRVDQLGGGRAAFRDDAQLGIQVTDFSR